MWTSRWHRGSAGAGTLRPLGGDRTGRPAAPRGRSCRGRARAGGGRGAALGVGGHPGRLPGPARRRGAAGPLPRPRAHRGAAARLRGPVRRAPLGPRRVRPAARPARCPGRGPRRTATRPRRPPVRPGGARPRGRRRRGRRTAGRRHPPARPPSSTWSPRSTPTRCAASRPPPSPRRFRLLVAAESAGALAAAEMAHEGMPWRRGRARRPAHRAARAEAAARRAPGPAAGPRRRGERGLRPAGQPRLAAADPQGVPRRTASTLPSTRSQVLKQVDHPAVAPLLAYKELARLHSFHGWAWADQWVRGDRFHPEYVVGGVVSGRWATSGGGALQIPKVLRRVVVADEGWTLVVADAAQLEPRVLAAISGDRGLARAAGETDLYAALARGVRRRPGERQDRAAVRDVRRGVRRRGPAARRAAQAVPAGLRVRGGGGPGGGGGAAGAFLAGPYLPAAVAALAGAGGRARGRPRGPRPGPVHPQLRGAGHGRRVGAHPARRAARPAAANRPGWCSSSTTR